MESTREMERVLALYRANENFIVLGSAGTGKSVLLRKLVAESRKNVQVVAPTGLAAMLAGGKTIHSFFGMRWGLQRPKNVQLADTRLEVESRMRRLRDLKVLLIDEISMVRADILDAIDMVLREHGPSPGAPFGGIQIGLFGDVLQLPPIVKTNERQAFIEGQDPSGWKSEWFFDAKAFAQANFKRVRLTKIFRQADEQEFAARLQRLRTDRMQPEDYITFNQRCDLQNVENALAVVARKKQAVAINTQRFNALAGEVFSFTAEHHPFNWPNGWEFPAPKTLDLKIGARVMLLANIGGSLVNGRMGTVEALSKSGVRVRFDGEVHIVSRYTWELPVWEWDAQARRMIEKEAVRFTQIPLRLAWAMTIHKVQGQTLEADVMVDFGHSLWSPGQAYVAVSRVRTIAKLYLARPLVPEHVIMDKRAVGFDELTNSLPSIPEIRQKVVQIYTATRALRDETKKVHSEAQPQIQAIAVALREIAKALSQCQSHEANSKAFAERAEASEKRVNSAIDRLRKAGLIGRLLGKF